MSIGDFPRNVESTNLSRDKISREIGRTLSHLGLSHLRLSRLTLCSVICCPVLRCCVSR